MTCSQELLLLVTCFANLRFSQTRAHFGTICLHHSALGVILMFHLFVFESFISIIQLNRFSKLVWMIHKQILNDFVISSEKFLFLNTLQLVNIE